MHSLTLVMTAALAATLGCSASTEEPPLGMSGGANSGGTSNGGASNGGQTSGGAQNGGSSNGGAQSGGASNGGSSSGGKSAGGTSNGGKASNGGATNAGASSGGRSNGGASSGGRANGGASSGGASSGGSTTAAGGSVVQPGKKFVGNITTGDTVDTGGLSFAKFWDQITPENAGKWGSVQSSGSSAFNWSKLDAIYDYTQKNNVIFKQHTFIWGNQQPSGSISEAQVKSWMSAFCKRYPNTKLIDVVNEPPPHTTPSYANSIGGGTNGDWKWITNAFTWAREACPNAILILNDYNNIEWDNEHAHFIDIVKKIKAAGAPIDAVGAQSHDVYRKTNAELQTKLDNLHTQTGLPVYITEYDVSDTNDTNQLNIYKQQFPLLYGLDYVPGITIWGWIYGRTWSQAPNSGLVNNGKSRPAMTWLMQQLGRTAP